MLIVGVSFFSIVFVIIGLWKLKQNEITIKINKETIANIKLVLIVVGFVLICIDIDLSSVFNPVINGDGNFTGLSWLSWQPFGLQGIILFWMGTGIQFLELVW